MLLAILASMFIYVETDRYIALVPAAELYIKPAPVEEPSMSDEWQAAVIEACDNFQSIEPTGNMFDDWQDAVEEATK